MTFWNFRFGREPVSKFTKLGGRNGALSDSIKKGFNNLGGKFCRRILGMLPASVEAADNFLADSGLLRRVSRVHHALC